MENGMSASDAIAEKEQQEVAGLQWWECALSLLRKKQERGIEGDVKMYSAVISACEAAGEWQRALSVLDSMLKENTLTDETGDENIRMNLHCFNAALSACEKGGAWIESLDLYYRMIEQGGPVRPNVISLNCVLIALEKSGQKELAQSTFEDGVRSKIVNVWRLTRDAASGELIDAMVSTAQSRPPSFTDSRKSGSLTSLQHCCIVHTGSPQLLGSNGECCCSQHNGIISNKNSNEGMPQPRQRPCHHRWKRQGQ